MELNFSVIPGIVFFACFLVVIFTELVKNLDKKNRLKGYRVYIALLFSAVATVLLALGEFIPVRQAWFWGVTIFGISVFFFEALVRKIRKIHEGD